MWGEQIIDLCHGSHLPDPIGVYVGHFSVPMGGRVRVLIVCTVACVMMLQGCASSGEDSFAKSNVSPGLAQRDAQQCWEQAQKKEVPERAANENGTAAVLIGGLVGLAVNQTANEHAYRTSLRDQCMARRGYTKQKTT